MKAGDYSRGADTLFQSARMFVGSTLKVITVALLTAIVVAGIMAYRTIPADARYVTGWWTVAWILERIAPDRDFILTLDGPDGPLQYQAHYFANHPIVIKARDQVFGHVIESANVGGVVGVGVMVGFGFISVRKGRKLRDERLIRGGQIVTASALRRLLKRQKKASDIPVGEIPLVAGTEVQHTLIAGTTGTGKTQLTSKMLDAVRRRGEPAVIYDATGDYVRTFWREGDVILCPMDARSPAWSPWAEIGHPADASRIAASLIPIPNSGDPFWAVAAQSLFAGAVLKLRDDPERSISKLIHIISGSTNEELESLLKGLPISSLFIGKGGHDNRMAASVRGTLLPYLEALQFLPSDANPETEFSLRAWVENASTVKGRAPWLFITTRANYHQSSRPLISCWLDSLAFSLMSLRSDTKRRLWFFIDELPSLNRLPSINRLLAEARKYGAACVLGIQGISQLRSIYGRDDAESIASLCNTHAIFRLNDPDSAHWASRLLCEREVEEPSESMTYSANDKRDSINLSQRRYTRPIVMPTEIQQLENLHCFVKLAGNYPIANTSVRFQERREVAPAYIEVDVGESVWASFLKTSGAKSNHAQAIEPIQFN